MPQPEFHVSHAVAGPDEDVLWGMLAVETQLTRRVSSFFYWFSAVPALVLSLVLTGYSDVHCHSLLGVFGHILKLLSILTKRIVLYSPKGSHATGHGSTVEARQK